MAKIDVNVSMENVMHRRLALLASNIQEMFGVRIETVAFDWRVQQTMGGPEVAVLNQVRVTSASAFTGGKDE